LRSERGYFSDGDIYIGLENIESSSGKYIQTETEYDEELYDIVRKGDVLFGKLRPYLEKVYISAIDGFCTGEFLNFRRFEGDKRYLYYFLLSPSFIETVNASTYGAKMPRAEWDFIKNLRILIPPLKEQQAITAFLDAQCNRIDNIITEMEQQIEVLKQYKTSLITETVTKGLNKSGSMKDSRIDWIGNIPAHWEVNRLGFLFTFGKGLNITKEDLQDVGIPCVNYGEIHSKYSFEVSPEKNTLRCVDEKYFRTNRSSLLKHGDFLFADTSEDLDGSGNFTYLNSSEKTFAGYHTIILRTRKNINHRYIAYLFDSTPFRTQIRNKVWGIKVYSITQPILKNAKILLPPLKEQQDIAAFLDTQCGCIDNISAEKRQSIETMRAYKKSLIYEYVTGKKRVKGYQ
jgi:type I restriction enzyme S subunit